MTLLWWHWLVLGLLLGAAEVATAGGFVVIFFGIGAVIVGVLAALGIAGPMWMQVLLFSVCSVGSLLMFRSRWLRAMQRGPASPEVDTLVGELGTASEPIGVGQTGKVEVRGTAWSARNVATVACERGARCRVVRVEGLRLDVEPEGVQS